VRKPTVKERKPVQRSRNGSAVQRSGRG